MAAQRHGARWIPGQDDDRGGSRRRRSKRKQRQQARAQERGLRPLTEAGKFHAYAGGSWVRLSTVPPDLVRADPKRQVPFGLGGFAEAYADAEKTCIECGQEFVFSATEQQFWYEQLKFPLHSIATRCRDCRRRRRTARLAQRRLATAIRAVADQPRNAAAHLELAEATVVHVAATGGGNIDQAIHAARRAVQLDPGLSAGARYWEAKAQDLAGRADLAIAAYERFIDTARGSPQRSTQEMLAEARRRQAELRKSTETVEPT
jgi:tetratricopeptide (TPR) repeat protein